MRVKRLMVLAWLLAACVPAPEPAARGSATYGPTAAPTAAAVATEDPAGCAAVETLDPAGAEALALAEAARAVVPAVAAAGRPPIARVEAAHRLGDWALIRLTFAERLEPAAFVLLKVDAEYQHVATWAGVASEADMRAYLRGAAREMPAALVDCVPAGDIGPVLGP